MPGDGEGMAEVIDLTQLKDEGAERPPKRARVPPTEQPTHSTSDSDVVAVEMENTSSSTSPLARSASPFDHGFESSSDDEDVHVVGNTGQVWNRDYSHLRHQCGMHTFVNAIAISNHEACENCFCFICDIPASECSFWGSGAQAMDHCNGYPDTRGFFRSLKQRMPSAVTSALNQRESGALSPAMDMAARALEELPPPGGDGMVYLGEVRLQCKVTRDGLTMEELDQGLIRHGVFTKTCEESRLNTTQTGGKYHIENMFRRKFRNGALNIWDDSPLELLPLPHTSEVVPPERVVPVTVYHCDGSSCATTFGIETNEGDSLKAILTKAKRCALHDTAEPPGGVIYASFPNAERLSSRGLECFEHPMDSHPWGIGPIMLILPAVTEFCPPSQTKNAHCGVMQLVIHMYRNENTASKPEDFPMAPIILTVDREFINGGEAAARVIKECILKAMRPFLKPGKEASSSLLFSVKRCMAPDCSPELVLALNFSDMGRTSNYKIHFKVIWSKEAEDVYDFNKVMTPKILPSAAPHLLAESQARQSAKEKQSDSEEDARAIPYDILEEIIAAQRCGKPEKRNSKWVHEFIIQLFGIPTLRVRLELEFDGPSATFGNAVFKLWTWKDTSPSPTLDTPAHRPLMPAKPQYDIRMPHIGTSYYGSCLQSIPLPTTLWLMAKGVPGHKDGKEAIQNWKDLIESQRIDSIPALLSALETGEIEPSVQPRGLTVTLRPYQLQTLGFMQRAERNDTGLTRCLWFPGPIAECKNGGASQDGSQLPAWWWSPVLGSVSLSEPECKSWGGFLAETMGLGKTVEVLALILSDRPDLPAVPERLPTLFPPDHPERRSQQAHDAPESGNGQPEKVGDLLCSNATLVICAVSLVGQWVAEAQDKAGGSLRIYQYHGTGRTRNVEQLALKYDIVVTTYSTLSADWNRSRVRKSGDPTHRSPLHAIQWYRLVMDESHSVKDPSTGQSKACVALEASRRWCCSGTPIATDIMDLQGQFAALRMPPFSDKSFFFPHYRHALRNSQKGAELFYVLSCAMVRHTGSQITGGEAVLSLPPMQQSKVEVVFTPTEAGMYRSAYKQAEASFQSFLSKDSRKTAAANASMNLLSIMSLLLPLRRIASGGELRTEDLTVTPTHNAKERQLWERFHCPVCLNALEVPTTTPCGHTFCHECIVGLLEQGGETAEEGKAASCPTCQADVELTGLAMGEGGREGQPSAEKTQGLVTECDSKLRALVAELRAMRERDASAKALVFSQFASTFDWLKCRLPSEGFSYRTIDGSMPLCKRTAAIADFQGDPPTTVFLLSMRAGAVGINLTAASHVFLLEPALNPALEEQAIGRAWRMGQTRSVIVKRFFVKGSVEQSLMELNERRAKGNDAKVDGGGECRSKSMKQQDVAGSLNTDRQNLKLEELKLLFSPPSV